MPEKIKTKIYKFLRWSEKYTKTDMVYLTTGGFWFTLSQIISNILSFGLSIAYANLLTQETFGTYKYVLSVYGFISLVTLPGLTSAVTQSVSRGFEGSLRSGVKKKFSWSLLGTIVSLALAAYYLIQGDVTLSISMVVVAFFIPFMESFGIFTNFLEGKKRFKEKVIYDIVINFFSVVAVITTIFFTKNIFLILIAYFASYSVGRILFHIITLKKFKPGKNTDDQMYSFGKNLTLFQIVSNATQYIDKILLFTMLGAPQVAIFTFATALPERIKYLFRFTGIVSFPKFANKPFDESRKSLPRKLAISGAAIFAVIVFYILIAPLVFKYIFPQYTSAVLFSQVIALTTIYAVTYPIGALLTAHKKVKELFVISFSSFLFGVIAMVIFIPIYGIWGAVIGTTINRLTNIISSFYFLKKVKVIS